MKVYTKNTFVLFILVFSLFFSGFVNAADTRSTGTVSDSSTGIVENTEDFRIIGYEVHDYNKVVLIFNSDIYEDEETIYSFTVINNNNEFDDLYVEDYKISKINKNKVLLTLNKNAEVGLEYEIIAENIMDENLRNIKSYVDSIVTFVMPEEIDYGIDDSEFYELELIEENELSQNGQEENISSGTIEEEVIIEDNSSQDNTGELIDENNIEEESEVELNSADEESTIGEDVEEDFIENNVLSESKEADKLPETGPSIILLFLITVLLASGFYAFKLRKS